MTARTWAALLAGALAIGAGCIDFQAAYDGCFDGGACVGTLDGQDAGPTTDAGPQTDAGAAGDAGETDAGTTDHDAGHSEDAGVTDFATCNEHGTCWENPLPQGNTLNAVFTFGPDQTWVAGARGALLRHDGVTWRSFSGFEESTLYDLWGRSSDGRLFAAGIPTSGVWSGSGWLPRAVPGEAVAGTDTEVLMVSNLKDWRFDAFDSSWVEDLTSSADEDLWHTPEGWYGINDTGVYGPGASGVPEQPVTYVGALRLRAGGAAGGVGWVAADAQTLLRRDADGGWSIAADGGAASPAYLGLWAESATRVWLAGENATLQLYTDGGLSDRIGLPMPAGHLRAVHGSTGADVWAVGDDGLILRSDGGLAVRLDTGPRSNLERVRAAGGYLLAAGAAGRVLERTASGWTPAASNHLPTRDVDDAWLGPNGEFLLVADDVHVRLPDGGSSVEQTPGFFPEQLWASSLDNAFLVTQEQTLHRRQGTSWPAFSPDAGAVDLVWGTPDGTELFTLTSAGVQSLSLADGGQWSARAAPVGLAAPYSAVSDGQHSWLAGGPQVCTDANATPVAPWSCATGFTDTAPVIDLTLCGATGLCALTPQRLYLAPDRTNLSSWIELDPGTEASLRGIAAPPGSPYVWVVGDKGAILRVRLDP